MCGGCDAEHFVDNAEARVSGDDDEHPVKVSVDLDMISPSLEEHPGDCEGHQVGRGEWDVQGEALRDVIGQREGVQERDDGAAASMKTALGVEVVGEEVPRFSGVVSQFVRPGNVDVNRVSRGQRHNGVLVVGLDERLSRICIIRGEITRDKLVDDFEGVRVGGRDPLRRRKSTQDGRTSDIIVLAVVKSDAFLQCPSIQNL